MIVSDSPTVSFHAARSASFIASTLWNGLLQYRMMFLWCRCRSDQIHVRAPLSGMYVPPSVAAVCRSIHAVVFGLTYRSPSGPSILASSVR